MASDPDHPLIENVRKLAPRTADLDRADLAEVAALETALLNPEARAAIIDNVEQHFKADDGISLRRKAQLVGLRRHLIDAHNKYLAVKR